MLTKKTTKKQFLEHVSHNGVFQGIWNGFGDFGHFLDKKNVHFLKIHPRIPTISPLTLTFLLFKPWHFLTLIQQSTVSFAQIKLKISVRDCGGWSHDQQKIERVF